jgi:hypothetical protein
LVLISLWFAVRKPDNILLHMASYFQPFGAPAIAVCYFFPRGAVSGRFTLLWLAIAVLGAFGAE